MTSTEKTDENTDDNAGDPTDKTQQADDGPHSQQADDETHSKHDRLPSTRFSKQ